MKATAVSPTQNSKHLAGLSDAQVAEARRKHGANVITPPERDPWWKLFLEKFDDPVIRILMIAAGIAIGVGAMHGDYLEGIGIIIAVLLATTIAFLNEFKANREFDILNQVNDDVLIKVIRNGQMGAVPRKDIVVGDLVFVEAGEEVPADGTLVEAMAVEVNESGLTGESEPNKKVARDFPGKDQMRKTAYPPDQVLRGCMLLDGHGTFQVTAVGDHTEIGRTARAAAEETGEVTPLNRQLEKLSKWIGVIGLGVASATFLALVFRGALLGELVLSFDQWIIATLFALGLAAALSLVWLPMVFDGLNLAFGMEPPSWLEGDENAGWVHTLKRWAITLAIGAAIIAAGMGAIAAMGRVPDVWLPGDAGSQFLQYFMIAVTIIVVAVPEGLAMSVTLSLAYSMRKMTAANTLVRKMHACETIGAATVICSDKTGTLTMNEMRVFEMRLPAGLTLTDPTSDASSILAEAIAANTTAHLGREGAKATKCLGNPTEGALLFWLEEQGIDYVTRRNQFPITYQLTFSTERKWMGTFGTSPRTRKQVFHVKGAPEIVIGLCTRILTPAGPAPMNGRAQAIQAELQEYQRRGMRTLGFAYHDDLAYAETSKVEQLASQLTWVGFAAIADPVRPEVPPAVQACRTAGIKVKMVTGDNPDTACEIARQIGLTDQALTGQQHVSGSDFRNLQDEEAKTASANLLVLSRAKPLDKVRLVRSLQAKGEVVAVTGDGINDCGALNYADVGLAMGKTGKAAAKEASDIVLLDDSFRTIVNAVLWGRSLYQNIQRFILFQLTINVAALGIAFLGPFIGVKLPLTVIQMLWVNLIMDTFAALALATEPPHQDVMGRPPRKPEDFIVTKTMAAGIFSAAAIFLAVLIGLLVYFQGNQESIGPNQPVTSHELSIFFTVFVLLQFWNLFNARCLGLRQSAFTGLSKNPGFLAIALAIFAGQFLIVQFGGGLFRTSPLSLQEWAWITATTSLVLWLGEAWRLLLRAGPRKNQI
jgi:Ca2+-transporting ATPase